MEDVIWALVPLAAIVLLFGRGTTLAALQTWERVHMAKLQARSPGSGLSGDQVALLREEFARLRDTTTQHSISMQHSMERLEQRVEFLERKTPATVEPMSDTPRQQIAGRI